MPTSHPEQLLERFLGISPELGLRLLASAAIFIGYAVLLRLTRRVVGRVVEAPSSRYEVMRATTYALGVAGLLMLAKTWVAGLTGLATYLGLLSAGIAVALQEPLSNLAGWLFILARRPFRVGDRIQIGPHAGDVVDIRIFRFLMLEIGGWVDADQSTGRVVHVPNGWVFKHSVANYDGGFGYLWNEIAVVVTFESDWRKAKAVLTRVINAHAEHLTEDAVRRIDAAAEEFHIRFSKLTPVVWTSAVDHGVKLTMRYLCKPRDRRSSTSSVWEAVLDEFSTLPDIDLAYPTTRRFDHVREGKTSTSSGAVSLPQAGSEAAPPVEPPATKPA